MVGDAAWFEIMRSSGESRTSLPFPISSTPQLAMCSAHDLVHPVGSVLIQGLGRKRFIVGFADFINQYDAISLSVAFRFVFPAIRAMLFVLKMSRCNPQIST